MKITATFLILLALFSPNNDAITDIAFSPDGEMLASGSEDGTAQLWKITE